MADLMTHALVAFSAATVLSWRFTIIDHKYITVAMVGAVLPDVIRIGLIVNPARVEETLGVPFSWHPLHTLGGALIAILLITTLVQKKHSKPLFLLLTFGAISHLFLDSLLMKASGHSYPIFFPLSNYRPPTPGLYMSPDVWPVMIAALLTAAVLLLDRENKQQPEKN